MSIAAVNTYFNWLKDNPEALEPQEKNPVITDLFVSQARLETLGVTYPEEFYAINGELQLVMSGTVPTVVSNWKGFDCLVLNGYKYLLFCPKGVNGASTDFGDDGTWEGPRAQAEASKEASEAWKEWVSNPSG
jgi:hypothetical protein